MFWVFGLVFAPFLLIAMIYCMVKLNSALNGTVIMLLPFVLCIVFIMKNWNLLVQYRQMLVRYSLVPVIIALILSLYIGRKWTSIPRMLFTVVVCVAACIVPLISASKPVQAPVSVEEMEKITEATIYRSKGEAFVLDKQQISEFQTLMTEITVQRDLIEKSMGLAYDDSNNWYGINATLEDGTKYQIVFFQQSDEPELMRVDKDGVITCYQATEEQENLAGDWINGEIKAAIRQAVLDQYREPLRRLKESFSINETMCSFTIPEGLPEDLEIEIVGLPDDKIGVIYFLKNHNETYGWTVGETYTFDAAAYNSYRYIYLKTVVDGEEFTLIDIFERLPEEMRSKEPRKHSSEIEL